MICVQQVSVVYHLDLDLNETQKQISSRGRGWRIKIFKDRELKRNGRETKREGDLDRKYSLRPLFPILTYPPACCFEQGFHGKPHYHPIW